MHVPTIDLSELEIAPFELPPEYHGDYDAGKWMYVPPEYTEYRYILGTRCENPLICIGINPSTASPLKLDRTLESVARIAGERGYPGWVMFNVYAQRATRPDDMDIHMNPDLHRENMRAFEYILSLCTERPPSIWAAWGTIINKRLYLKDCLRDMIELGESYGAQWLFADKLLKAGHPHHPLYLRRDCALNPFDIREYLTKL